MPRWLTTLRASVVTGLTFATVVGGISAVIGAVGIAIDDNTVVNLLRTTGRVSVVSFLLGVGFAGILAIVGRRRKRLDLSIPRFALYGASAGLVYFVLISLNAWRVWTPRVAVLNFVVLTVIGAVAASATAWLARRTGSRLAPDDASALSERVDPFLLREADAAEQVTQHGAGRGAPAGTRAEKLQ